MATVTVKIRNRSLNKQSEHSFDVHRSPESIDLSSLAMRAVLEHYRKVTGMSWDLEATMMTHGRARSEKRHLRAHFNEQTPFELEEEDDDLLPR